MTRRWLGMAAAAILAALTLAWWMGDLTGPFLGTSSISGPRSAKSLTAPVESSADARREPQTAPTSTVVTTPSAAKEGQPAIEISLAEFEERQATASELLVSRGYVDWPSTHPAYLAYDDETLTKLAEGGDVLAQTWLATKKTYSDPRGAMRLFREAALRGSTFSVLQIAQIQRKFVEGTLADNGYYKSADARQEPPGEHLPEAVAWGMVALARGDQVAIAFLHDLQNESPLDQKELILACQKFHDYYSELAADRMQLGLGEFDNMPSPLVTVPYSTASTCNTWPVPKPACRAVTRSGQPVGYTCDAKDT